jgi:glycosyltransferase involved in cell wall biosynthesis
MKILTLADYFLPGFKAGGPIRTIANMVERMGSEYEFLIFTRDRDLGAASAYPGVQINAWNTLNTARVFYAAPGFSRFRHLFRVLRSEGHNVLYLNSFFSWRSTLLPLLLLRLGLARKVPVLLAPRGEFSEGALGLKAAKKRLYMQLTRALGLYAGITWQASSEDEAKDIHRVMKPGDGKVTVAPNLLPVPAGDMVDGGEYETRPRSPGTLRIVFLSRISPMKNLDFLLRVLKGIVAELSLDIYGPTEDVPYWEQCVQLIAELPSNIQVDYRGAVSAEDVCDVFMQYDLFVFPTRGENFGHVIIESLNVGTPVLLSDRTPWRADPDGAIEVVELDDEHAWLEAISRWCRAGTEVLLERRHAAVRYARMVRTSDQAIVMNRRLFEHALGSSA